MMLTEETSVASAALPLAALKDHLRLGSGFADDTLQDSLIESYLRAAMSAIRSQKYPLASTATFSPGSAKFVTAVSMPPEPVLDMAMVNGLAVPNRPRRMRLHSSTTWKK